MDRDYEMLLHQMGNAPPSHAMTLANNGHPPAQHAPDMRAMTLQMEQMRQQLAQMHAAQAPQHGPPPPQHAPPQHYGQQQHQPRYAHEIHQGQHPQQHHQAHHQEHPRMNPSVHHTNANKIRNFPVGFVREQIPAGQLGEIEVKPQVRFQGHRLAVGQSCARYFNIIDIKVGKDSQLAATGEMPAEAFSSLSVGTQMELDPAPPGIVITLIVRNTDTAPQNFGAVLYGIVEEGDR